MYSVDVPLFRESDMLSDDQTGVMSLQEEYRRGEAPAHNRTRVVSDVLLMQTLVSGEGRVCWICSVIKSLLFSFHGLLFGSKSVSPAHTQGKGNKALPSGCGCIHIYYLEFSCKEDLSF